MQRVDFIPDKPIYAGVRALPVLMFAPPRALHQATLLKSGARLRGIARGRPIGAAGVRPVCPSLNKDRKATMARKPATRVEFTLFDVVYQDGSQRSNRRVPSEVLSGLDGDAPARAIIEEQDRLIAEKSGIPAISVKSIYRSDSKKADEAVRSLLSASASKR
jgi:hypothetical protein